MIIVAILAKLKRIDIILQMEKYSKHLEVLVGERTQDLENEKLKTDRLLYSKLNNSIQYWKLLII